LPQLKPTQSSAPPGKTNQPIENAPFPKDTVMAADSYA